MSRLCFLVAFSFAISFATVQDNISFLHSKIIPDVVDVGPPELVSVIYPYRTELSVGNVLTPTQAKNPPRLTWHASPGKYYTFLMTDPDVSPTQRTWLHWLVGNVPEDNVDAGDIIAEYIGAGPAKDTGPHRYVFLVYEQPEPDKIWFDEPRLTNRSMFNRANFSIRNFAWKYNLGDPIAGNFFQAEWDDYVPILYRSLRTRPRPRPHPLGATAGVSRLSTASSMIVLTSVIMLVLNI